MKTRLATDRLRQALTEAGRYGPQPEVWVRFPRQLGDVVFTLPFLGGLQESWNAVAAETGLSLRWVAVGHRMGASIFSEAKPGFFADSVLEQGGSGKPDPWYLLRRWRKQPPVAVINLSQSARLALAAWMVGVPLRAGIADNHLTLLYHYSFKYRDLPIHLSERYRPLLEQLTGTKALKYLRIGPHNLGGDRAKQVLEDHGWKGEPFVTLNFGTQGYGKRWSPERQTWPSLARLLLSKGIKVVWNGGPAEVPLGAELAALAPGSWDLSGKTNIPEGIALQSLAMGNVAVDTGLAHSAAATGRPTVVLMGPTAETLYLPVGPKVIALRGCPVDVFPGQSDGWTRLGAASTVFLPSGFSQPCKRWELSEDPQDGRNARIGSLIQSPSIRVYGGIPGQAYPCILAARHRCGPA